MALLGQAIAWIKGWVNAWRHPSSNVISSISKKDKTSRKEDKTSKWEFKRDILDELDYYYRALKRLKKCDRESWKIYHRFGLLIPSGYVANPDSDMWNPERAVSLGLGGIVVRDWAGIDKAGKVHPAVLYFRKIAQPYAPRNRPRVELAHNSDLFEFSAVYHLPKTDEMYVAVFHMAVCRALGHARLLKECETVERDVGKGVCYKTKQWRYPPYLVDWAQEAGSTPSKLARKLFDAVRLTYVNATDAMIVRASRSGVTAAFGIELTRCPRFFADRGVERVAADGKRKRIFHYVRPHKRIIGAGRATTVCGHYRGIRDFEWNGSDIHIVLPKNTRIMRIPVESEHVDGQPVNKDMIGSGKTGKVLAKALQS